MTSTLRAVWNFFAIVAWRKYLFRWGHRTSSYAEVAFRKTFARSSGIKAVKVVFQVQSSDDDCSGLAADHDL